MSRRGLRSIGGLVWLSACHVPASSAPSANACSEGPPAHVATVATVATVAESSQDSPCTCCDGPEADRTPPRIRRARFVSGRVIELTFTEPVVSIASVDPQQFRISFGMAYTYEKEASAQYSDICLYSGECASDMQTVRVNQLRSYAGGRRLRLHLNQPVSAELCYDIREYQKEFTLMSLTSAFRASGSIGLFVHYTSEGGEPVRDRSGNRLEEIGESWALASGAEQGYAYDMSAPIPRAFAGLIPLPCTLAE